MRNADLAVNLTGMGQPGALVWSSQAVPAAAMANPSVMDRGYCGFGLITSTHKAIVRPAGLRRGSTG